MFSYKKRICNLFRLRSYENTRGVAIFRFSYLGLPISASYPLRYGGMSSLLSKRLSPTMMNVVPK